MFPLKFSGFMLIELNGSNEHVMSGNYANDCCLSLTFLHLYTIVDTGSLI